MQKENNPGRPELVEHNLQGEIHLSSRKDKVMSYISAFPQPYFYAWYGPNQRTISDPSKMN